MVWRPQTAMYLLAVCGLLGFGIRAEAALAAPYHVYTCHTPTQAVAPTDGWTAVTNGAGAYVIDDCGGHTSYALTAALDGQTGHPTNVSNAIWTFTTASNVALAGATLFRREALPGGVGPNSTYVTFFGSRNLVHDAANVFDNCQANLGCTFAGTNSNAFDVSNREVVPPRYIAGSQHLFMEAYCGGTNGETCPPSPGNAAEADLYAADLTLDDAVAPVAANLAGSLVGGSTLTGSADVTFTASDLGSGVYSAQLSIDGQQVKSQVIDANGGRCQTVGQATDGLRDFRYQAPCRPFVNAGLSLDTSAYRDGHHALLVSVDDAAGNVTTVFAGTIVTHNAGGPTVGPAAAAPSTGPAPGGGHVANGTGACETAKLTAGFGARPVARVSAGRGATLKGALDCGGRPIGGATLDVAVTSRANRAAPAVAQVMTAPDGTYMFAVAPGPSRSLTVSYRAFSDDAVPAATAGARLDVAASIALSIGPLRVHNGQTISYTGRVFGGSIPASGLALDVQYRDGRRWRTFDQTRARTADGRFLYHYTFKRTTALIVYTFRVVIPPRGVSGYPYSSTASRPRSVRVEP